MDISFLQILLYVLGAIFLVCLIVLSIKVIYTVNRINFLLDNIERKISVLDKARVAKEKSNLDMVKSCIIFMRWFYGKDRKF